MNPNTEAATRTLPVEALLTLTALVHAGAVTSASRLRSRAGEEGQTTAEYALVGLAAAAIAMLVMAWATKTKGIGNLLDGVIGQVIGRIL